MSEPTGDGLAADVETLIGRVCELVDERPETAGRVLEGTGWWMSAVFEWTVKERSAIFARAGGGLVVRVSKEDHARFGVEAGVEPLQSSPRGVGGWIAVGARVCESEDGLWLWVERGLAFTATMPHPGDY
jgi:hypothetical protein